MDESTEKFMNHVAAEKERKNWTLARLLDYVRNYASKYTHDALDSV
jgi:hypothetical protein